MEADDNENKSINDDNGFSFPFFSYFLFLPFLISFSFQQLYQLKTRKHTPIYYLQQTTLKCSLSPPSCPLSSQSPRGRFSSSSVSSGRGRRASPSSVRAHCSAPPWAWWVRADARARRTSWCAQARLLAFPLLSFLLLSTSLLSFPFLSSSLLSSSLLFFPFLSSSLLSFPFLFSPFLLSSRLLSYPVLFCSVLLYYALLDWVEFKEQHIFLHPFILSSTHTHSRSYSHAQIGGGGGIAAVFGLLQHMMKKRDDENEGLLDKKVLFGLPLKLKALCLFSLCLFVYLRAVLLFD